MFPFDRISINQILVLSRVLAESTLLETEFIEEKYLKNASNFMETMEFLSKISCINKKKNRIVLTPEYKSEIKKFIEFPNKEEIIRKYVLKKFIVKKNHFSTYIFDFLTLFQFKTNKYEFSPTRHQRLKYSGLRNLLISLDFIKAYPDKRTFFISEEYRHIYEEIITPKSLSLDEFLKIVQKRNKLGSAAELEALKYEKNRLSRYPLLVDKIEHVSPKNVGAGYDIKSYDKSLDESGQPIPRYIEVKAVSSINYDFYWSKNEIDKARDFRQNYYLYLIPTLGNGRFDIGNILIIRDAYLNVYKNKERWQKKEQLIEFALYEDSHKEKSGNIVLDQKNKY